MRKFFLALPLIVLPVLCWARVTARADGRRLIVNELPVLTFAEADNDLPQMTKAERWAQLLMEADGRNVRVQPRGRSVAILVGSGVLTTIDAGEAKLYGVSPWALANTWAKGLRSALKLPALKPETTAVRLGPQATASVKLLGSSVRSAQAESSNRNLVTVKITDGQVVLRGLSPGVAFVNLVSSEGKASMRVRVLPRAAELPQSVTAMVTGAPATSLTVRGALRTALQTQLDKAPGAILSYNLGDVQTVPTGESRTLTIRVRAEGPDCIATEGVVTATVQNQAISPVADSELWFCNRPESIKGPGNLFWGSLKPDQPARMLYHHYNASGSELIVRVTAVNASDKPADLWLIPGDSDPTRNPALAGMRAADQFARNWVCHSGEIVRIPPRSTLPITLRKLYQTQTMSGLCSLRLLRGGPDSLAITATATTPFSMDESWRAALRSSTPWHEVGCQPLQGKFEEALRPSEHIYGKPFLDEEFIYKVGDDASKFRLGSKEIVQRGTGLKLGGNYGVMYNLRTTLDNPTKSAAEVELTFRASGGYSGAVFLIDGNVVKTPLLNPNQEVTVSTFKVQPGLRRFLMIQTIPLSGSSYPATISLKMVTPDARGISASVATSSK